MANTSSPHAATGRAQQRRAAGQCGKCNKPAMPGRSQCVDCWQRSRVNKQRAYERRKAGRFCRTCVSLIINGYPRCADCQRKAADAQRVQRQN